MDIDLDFVSEPNPCADDWAGSTKEPHPAVDLQAKIQAFLKQGGQIHYIAPGVSATPEGHGSWNPSFYAGAGLTAEMVEARAEHNRRMAESRKKGAKKGAKAPRTPRIAADSPQLKHLEQGD